MKKKYIISTVLVAILLSCFAIVGQNTGFSPPQKPLEPIDWSPGELGQRVMELSQMQLQIIEMMSMATGSDLNLDLMIETFELVDQLLCLSTDFDFYVKTNRRKYGCVVELEVKQITTNLDFIAEKSYKMVYSLTEILGIDIESLKESIMPGNALDIGLSFMGIDLESGEETVVIEETPEQLLENINELLREIITLMSSFNDKYRGIAIRNLQSQIEQSEYQRNSNLLVETN